MEDQSTMHERLGFGHALIFCVVILLGFCAFLAAWVAVGFLVSWLWLAASEAFQAALSGLGVAL